MWYTAHIVSYLFIKIYNLVTREAILLSIIIWAHNPWQYLVQHSGFECNMKQNLELAVVCTYCEPIAYLCYRVFEWILFRIANKLSAKLNCFGQWWIIWIITKWTHGVTNFESFFNIDEVRHLNVYLFSFFILSSFRWNKVKYDLFLYTLAKVISPSRCSN